MLIITRRSCRCVAMDGIGFHKKEYHPKHTWESRYICFIFIIFQIRAYLRSTRSSCLLSPGTIFPQASIPLRRQSPTLTTTTTSHPDLVLSSCSTNISIYGIHVFQSLPISTTLLSSSSQLRAYFCSCNSHKISHDVTICYRRREE